MMGVDAAGYSDGPPQSLPGAEASLRRPLSTPIDFVGTPGCPWVSII